MSLGDHKGAAEVAHRLLELDPAHVHGYLVLAGALIALKKADEGLKALENLLNYADASALTMGAEIASNAGNSQLATALITKAAGLTPTDSEVWKTQALIYAAMARYDDGWQAAARATELGAPPFSCAPELLRREAVVSPLSNIFSRISNVTPSLSVSDFRENVVEAIAGAMAESVKIHGPIYLQSGVRHINEWLGNSSILGEVLTGFLTKTVGQLSGPLEEWEVVLAGLRDMLADLKECAIPLSVLTAAVRFDKTRDQRHLLQLPLEQRQLLEEAMPETGSASPTSGN